MTDQEKKFLSDILAAIQLIEDFTDGLDSYQRYVADYKTQSAVERQLGIIGEAVNRFRKISPNKRIEQADNIVGFRNRIIHAYDAVDSAIIWTIINKHLQPLKTEITEFLNS